MVELGPDDLAESAQSTAETAEAAAEATEAVRDAAGAGVGPDQPGADTQVGRVASNAIREFAELKRAEKELEQVMAEESDSGVGLGEAIAEGAKVFREDPELIRAFKAYLWDVDPNDVDNPPAIAADTADPPAASHAAAEGRELPPAADGGAGDVPIEDRELDPDLAFAIGKLVLGELAQRHPTMTLSELRDVADGELESLQDQVGDEQLADLYERADTFEGPIKAVLSEKL